MTFIYSSPFSEYQNGSNRSDICHLSQHWAKYRLITVSFNHSFHCQFHCNHRYKVSYKPDIGWQHEMLTFMSVDIVNSLIYADDTIINNYYYYTADSYCTSQYFVDH